MITQQLDEHSREKHSYRDLREFLQTLEANQRLVTVNRPISCATELSPLVRLQYRGLPEEKRMGFLFNDVRDANGKKGEISRVATGVYASSMEIYALALNCEPTNASVQKKWVNAQMKAIDPVVVDKAPVQENVLSRQEMDSTGRGLNILPIPVEIPGFSGSVRTTTQIITKDPETGIQNMGEYSSHAYWKTKMLWEVNTGNHGGLHRAKAKEMGKKYLETAIVIGGPPVLFFVASAKLPYGVDELGTAAALAGGEPIEVVKCKTVDLNVPANAEIIIEGRASTEEWSPGNAFGEFNGYMATDVFRRSVLEVTAITYRKDPIFVHIMSQMAPSESSKVRNVSFENIYLKFLREDCRIPNVLDVALLETSQAQWCVVKIHKVNEGDAGRILGLLSSYNEWFGKIFIAVDDDIDPRDLESVIWALGFRMQPHRDISIVKGRRPGLDISAYRPDASHAEKTYPQPTGSSAVLIDATRKWPYPPTALPKKEFMENALGIWKELGLPQLNLKVPWHGYELGYWPKEYKEDAEHTLRGEYEIVGKRLEELGKAIRRKEGEKESA